ncbi:MAG: hypothetical protein ACM3S1_01770 [Hyphomicrobiales bacterium]
MKRLSLLVAAFAALLLGGVTAFSTIGDAAAANTTVNMQNLAFSPASITINAGDTVTWTNTTRCPTRPPPTPASRPRSIPGCSSPDSRGP